jgi:hypothetical protein
MQVSFADLRIQAVMEAGILSAEQCKMPDDAEIELVSDAARELESRLGQTVLPRQISALFYDRALRDDICPIVGGRPLIPPDYLPQIEFALFRRGTALSGQDGQRRPCSYYCVFRPCRSWEGSLRLEVS